jgi:hypothetical protein
VLWHVAGGGAGGAGGSGCAGSGCVHIVQVGSLVTSFAYAVLSECFHVAVGFRGLRLLFD